MAELIIEGRVIQKIATAAEWAASTLPLKKGEFAIVSDSTGKPVNIRVGNGTSPFSGLVDMFDSIQQNVNFIAVSSKALPTPTIGTGYTFVSEGAYTFNGSPAFTVPAGHWGTANWDGTNWSFTDLGLLHTVDVSNKLDTGGYVGTAQTLATSIPSAADSLGSSTTAYGTQRLVTEVDASVKNIQGTRNISLGTLQDGRYSTESTQDAATAYKKTDFIEVDPTWIGRLNSAQDANTLSVQFDEFRQPINRITYTANTDFTFDPRTKYIRISGTTATMNAKVFSVRESIGQQLATNVNKVVNNQKKTGLSLNYFNWQTDFLYQFTMAMTDGAITKVSSNYSATPAYNLKSRTPVIVGNIFVISNPIRIHWYRADGTQISYQEIPTASFFRTMEFSRYYVVSEVPPTDAQYFRVRYEYTTSSTTAQLQRLFISHIEYLPGLENYYGFKTQLTEQDVLNLDVLDDKINRTVTDKVFEVLGDSNTANLLGRGAWNIKFRDYLMPLRYTVRAEGGATLSSTEALFGQEYLTGGNTIIRQCERIIEQVINNTSYIKPDTIIIMGGTNDFDVSRHVTPTMLGTTPYDEYMESNFMTNSPSYNTLKDLTTVNRGQVAGAIRYIVERLGTYLPNARIIIATPIQSTLHNQLSASRVVRDIKWMANRLSIPVLDQWGKSNMPMLWDYGTNRRYLSDRVHVFSTDSQTVGSPIMGRFMVSEFLKEYIPLVTPIS